ncbi:class I SAM-dependent methyltransferase [Streptomyces sp. BK239]|uniref:class I SAM-dependent methyltransferase n=1 Tax=Streptomyces sp. BK239 TaxID=2512155 RepID=UPI00102B65C0|nr:class I SAM-dependent methyltransferase [Streptomyces sp. BK239]RZU21485.1 methyltransferase family protein [Streptomyces sp. BK239]
MTAPAHTDRALSFSSAAAQYAANRPSYPPALLEAIEAMAAHPLAGARVADIGAGTGIATALLHARGADVVAVEPGDGMAEQFRRALPEVPVVRGDGNRLPLATASVDFLTYAQSWHWTDPARSVPEAVRVLRPGGALVLWWNAAALDVPWIDAQTDRVQRHFGLERTAGRNGDGTHAVLAGPTDPLDFARGQVRWSRRVPLDTHLANIGSHSIFLVHGPESTAAFLEEERRHLLTVFPDGMVEETYDVAFLVALRP